MGRSRDIADFLSKTESTNTANRKLLHELSNVGVDSAFVSSQTGTIGLTYYNTLDSLPITGLSSGDQAYVAENSRLYLSNGSGWYNAALIRIAPTMTLDPTGTITLATDGTTTSTITIVAADSDTALSQLTYSVESDGNMLGRAVISQDSSVFTIRPLSEDSGATTGTFTLTFKTSDGTNLATDTSDFSLTFSTTVDSSSATALLMKARGNSLDNSSINYRDHNNSNQGFTETGSPEATTFNPYREGGYSIHMDGTGDTASISSSADFAYGTGDFTWEAWIYVPAAKANHYVLDHGSNGGVMSIANTKIRYYNTTVGTSSTLYTTGGTISYNTWHHVAFVRSSGTTTIYVDGVVGSSGSDGHNYGSQAVTIGNYGGGGSYNYQGFIRDLRLVKGTAVYTANFTPPTESLTAITNTSLLVGHLPYIADGSSTGHSITLAGNTHTVPFGPYDYNPRDVTDSTEKGGSVYFPVGGYVSTTSYSNLATFGSDDFTIELWYYPETFANYQITVSTRASTGTYGQFHSTTDSLGRVSWVSSINGSSWEILFTSTGKMQLKSWNHIAYVRNGTSCKVYINGKGETAGTTSGSFVAPSGFYIGSDNGGTYEDAVVYYSDVRISDNARYTADFTPPTTHLDHDANTTFLMNNPQDTGIYDAAAANAFLLTGDTISSTTQRKFTTSSSVYLDGTGDYIDTVASELFAFGTGDFTWEAWIYHTTYEPSYLLEFGTGGDLGIHHATAEGHLTYYTSTTGTGSTLYTTGFGSMSNTTWYHIAAVRINGTTYLYKDGVLQTSATDSTNYGIAPLRLRIGAYGNGGTYPWTGYIQDLRITKGKGRYTAAFTPPTTEFEL